MTQNIAPYFVYGYRYIEKPDTTTPLDNLSRSAIIHLMLCSLPLSSSSKYPDDICDKILFLFTVFPIFMEYTYIY